MNVCAASPPATTQASRPPPSTNRGTTSTVQVPFAPTENSHRRKAIEKTLKIKSRKSAPINPFPKSSVIQTLESLCFMVILWRGLQSLKTAEAATAKMGDSESPINHRSRNPSSAIATRQTNPGCSRWWRILRCVIGVLSCVVCTVSLRTPFRPKNNLTNICFLWIDGVNALKMPAYQSGFSNDGSSKGYKANKRKMRRRVERRREWHGLGLVVREVARDQRGGLPLEIARV